MSGVNKVFLLGRLGKDPEVRYTSTQQPFAKFSLATSEVFTTNGERREKTQWHNVVVWGKQAEIAGRYLRKGKQIFVEGKIEYSEYEDKTTGQKRYFTEIKVDRFQMLGGAGEGGGGGGYGGQQAGGYGQPSGGGYGGGDQGGGGYGGGAPAGNEPQSYGGNQGGGYGGAPAAPSKPPMSYGEPMADVPESDDFSDDDIPF